MQRVREDLFGVSLLDYLSQIHHRNAIRDVLDHRKIVRDEQVRQIESLLKLAKEIQNLSLDRYIECRNCFIAHDEFRFERKRPGDADPLALTSGEFVRVTVGVFSAETNEIEQLGYAFSRALPCRSVVCFVTVAVRKNPVDQNWFRDHRPDGHPGVERSIRVLKDDLHLAPQLAHLALAEREYIVSIEDHSARSRFNQS